MPDRDAIKKFPVVSSLLSGAKVTLEKCLSVTSQDKITIVCDHHSMEPTSALISVIESIGATYSVFILENHTERPTKDVPQEIVNKLRASTASIYAAEPMPGEYAHRVGILKTVSINRVKHAHILGLDTNTLLIGMAADYDRIAKICASLVNKLSGEPKIHIKSFSGTDLVIVPDVIYKPQSYSGIITPETWENLPTGEVILMPREADGVYVCDGHLPMDIKAKKTDLMRTPLRVSFKDNRLVDVEGGPGGVADQVKETLRSEEHLDRIGMVCLGTNYAIKAWSGNFVFDSYSPCAYVVTGDNSDTFAVPWRANNQLHFLGKRTSVLFDDEPIITAGQFDQAFLSKIK